MVNSHVPFPSEEEADDDERGHTPDMRRHDAALDLDEAIQALEAVDWRHVPNVSTVKAAVFAR